MEKHVPFSITIRVTNHLPKRCVIPLLEVAHNDNYTVTLRTPAIIADRAIYDYDSLVSILKNQNFTSMVNKIRLEFIAATLGVRILVNGGTRMKLTYTEYQKIVSYIECHPRPFRICPNIFIYVDSMDVIDLTLSN